MIAPSSSATTGEHMHNGLTRRSRRLTIAVIGAAVGLAALPALASAADPPFDPTCNGRVSLGEERSDGQLAYTFACSDDIKGYAIVTLNRETDAFDTEPIVLQPDGNPGPNQSFSCSAPIPSTGVSCTGSALAGNKATGSVNLTTDPCVGKRPEVALVVANGAGATGGPFRLVNAKPGPASRPLQGCPPAKAKKQKRRSIRRK
jgi:hypothetical protein